ncbi:MAG: oligosaccharide flippase family protein [Planctomycetaceae bacterium]|nr:oligosaccharide flippase family protein [Planctomycetaceae bacterium]
MKIRSPFNRPVTEGERQVAFSMSGLVICMVISQACAAATFLIFANSLGTANFGKLSGAIFLQNFFSTMSISGFRSVVIRELIKRPERQSRIIGSYLFLSGLIGCVILLLTTSTVFFFRLKMMKSLRIG